MNKTIKWILIGAGVLIVLLIAVRLLSGPAETGEKVTAEPAARRTIVETVTGSGKVYPEVEVKISPDISGEIVELNVEEGDSVRRGQVLARIYADIYSAQRDQAAARVQQSQATVANSAAALEALRVQVERDRQAYERNRRLFEDKVISRSEFETVEAAYRASQAQLEAARQNIRSLQAGVQGSRTELSQANKNLGRATITAPMDGVISLLNVKEGERVVGTAQMAGTEMMTVADMGSMEVRVEVGENDIVKVKVGDSADVSIEAFDNRKFTGVVTQIANSTGRATGAAAGLSNTATNYEVRVRLDPASYADLRTPGRGMPFRPGMNASADIKTTRKENVLSVPIVAVTTREPGKEEGAGSRKSEAGSEEDEEDLGEAPVAADLEEVVYVVNAKGEAEKRVVRTGVQDFNHIEILSGLKGGENVISAPFNAIKDLRSGTKVRVVKREELFTTSE